MIHIPIPDTFIGVAQIPSDSRDITGESGEPRPYKQICSTADHLIDHSQIIRIDVFQIRELHIIIQISDSGEILLESIEEGFISFIRGNVDQLVLRNELFDIVQDFLRRNFHNLVLKLSSEK
jgi:hypothetical protein